MQKRVFSIGLIFALCILFCPKYAMADIGVSAKSALVMEKDSGRVLYQKNADTKLPIASTTKIMTAIIALENSSTDTQIKISAQAAGVEGSSMYLEAGECLTILELLYGLMLSSGNDAAVAIAEHFGGNDNFVKLMNQKAEALGANNTHFANPNGLPNDNHYSTAKDMAIITAYALNIPTFREIVKTKNYSISGEGKAHPRTLTNHNKLLKMCDGCIGVKTGFTKSAGRCLVSAACRDNMTLICVTLNAPDDWNDHMSLYNEMFNKFHLCPILHSGMPLDSIDIENSETTSLPVTSAKDFAYPLADGEQCSTTITLSSPLSAPVSDATECGTITVKSGTSIIASLPLITVGEAERESVFKDNILRKIINFLDELF